MNKDVRIGKYRFHAVAVGYKIRRNIAAVELHTFDKIGCRIHRFGFFNGDNAVFSDFLDCVGKNLTDFGIVVCRNGCHVFDFFGTFNFF